MKVDKESVKQVLALFDEEDIPYIKSENLLKFLYDEREHFFLEQEKNKVKIKRIGDKYDRFRK